MLMLADFAPSLPAAPPLRPAVRRAAASLHTRKTRRPPLPPWRAALGAYGGNGRHRLAAAAARPLPKTLPTGE